MLQIIDAHAHIVTKDRIAFPPVRHGDPAIDAVLSRDFNAERLQSEAATNNVALALIVQRGQIYGTDNSYVCTAADASGGLLHAVCAINARLDDCSTLAKSWHAAGAVGFRLMGGLNEVGFDWLDGAQAETLWKTVADLDVPLCVHFFPSAREEGLTRLSALVKKFPNVSVVIDHLTNAPIDSVEDCGIDHLTKALVDHRNVILKFTTIPLGELQERAISAGGVLLRYTALFGADRLLWGSDVTQSVGDYGHMVDLARGAVADFDEQTQSQLLAGTAARVYTLGSRVSV